MNRWDILNHFIKKNNYKRYLEIGYYKGWSFDQVECSFKAAVDPNPCKVEQQSLLQHGEAYLYDQPEDSLNTAVVFKKTSDEFFIAENKKWDIIFIDGLHEAEQVYRDIQNALNHLNESGVIVLHDCNPPLYEYTTTGIDGCWTGDTYKAILDIQSKGFTEFIYYTVDTDWGCGVIKPFTKKESKELNMSAGVVMIDFRDLDWKKAKEDWNYFNEYRKELLNLISVEEFLERES